MVTPITPLTPEERAVVEAGGDCPRCYPMGYRLFWKGKTTGITIEEQYLCPCLIIKETNHFWHNELVVPKKFWDVRLATLKPESKGYLSLTRQAEIIAKLQSNPFGNYLFCGDSTTGKTHYSMALQHHALEGWAVREYKRRLEGRPILEVAVWRINTKKLLDEYVRYERRTGDDDEASLLPSLRQETIRYRAKEGEQVTLICDELDKFPPSKFKLDVLFELLDAVSETGGQIIAISNIGLGKLRKLWGEYPEITDAILARVAAKERNGALVTFEWTSRELNEK
jgi:hypothetical protein